jgi:enamine deaminase RidA (YjgF/YER057c/UK114 family)
LSGRDDFDFDQQESAMKIQHGVMAAVLMTAACAMQAQVVVKHLQPNEKSPIATGVWAGDTLYLSGQLASAVTPADAAKGTEAVYGDTKTQALSALQKIQALLKEQGLDMKDVVKMTVFLAGDPANGGKLDFAGLQASYTQFFGTKDQPNKPARSAVQVAALAAPWALVEIEVIAVKGK